MMRRVLVPISLLALLFILLTALGWVLGWALVRGAPVADSSAVQWAAAHRSDWLTPVMHLLSSLAGPLGVTAIVALAGITLLIRRRLWEAATIGFSAAGMLGLYELIVRLVARPRPPVLHLENPGGSSFPSGHEANSTATYVAILIVLFLVNRRPGVRVAALVLVAVLLLGIGISRIYLGLHYPSDVMVGFGLGLIWAFAMRRTVDAVAKAGLRDPVGRPV